MKYNKKIVVSIFCLLVIFLIFDFIYYNSFNRWHEEMYVLEDSSYMLIGKNVYGKDYNLAGEKINIITLPQTRDFDRRKSFYEHTGPYKISISLARGIYDPEQVVTLHNLEIRSEKGEEFKLTSSSFPMKIEPEAMYVEYTGEGYEPQELIEGKTEVSYGYDPEDYFNFNFEDRENIFITIDLEVIKNGQSKREKATFKLIPILNEGKDFSFPGEGV